jgi:hypothetical protein
VSEEKRAESSVRLRKFIDVVVEDKLSFTLFRGAIADLSSTGMRLISDQYLPKGTRYTFTMKRAPMLTLRGEVRWVRAFERDTFQCGSASRPPKAWSRSTRAPSRRMTTSSPTP